MTHRTEVALAMIVALALLVSVGFDIAAEYRSDRSVAAATQSHTKVR